MKTISIYLADDHLLLRQGIKEIISRINYFEVVGEQGDGKKALEDIRRIRPDIVILDIAMPSMNGIDISKFLNKYNPEIKIIILSQYNREDYVLEVFKNGAKAYLLKDKAGDDLIQAIKSVAKGSIYLGPDIDNTVANIFKIRASEKDTDTRNLTKREKEILKFISEGKSIKKIATILTLSPKTVRVHKANIMGKLNLSKDMDFIRYIAKNSIMKNYNEEPV